MEERLYVSSAYISYTVAPRAKISAAGETIRALVGLYPPNVISDAEYRRSGSSLITVALERGVIKYGHGVLKSSPENESANPKPHNFH